MVGLFLVEMTIGYEGLTRDAFLKIWLEEAEIAMKAVQHNAIKQIWKIVGERKVYLVKEAEGDELDKILFNLPLMKKMGNQVHVEVTALRPYEKFAEDMCGMANEEQQQDVLPVTTRDGLFYWLRFDVEYKGLDADEFFKIWAKEAKVAIGAKKEGMIVDLWKCIGMRRVHVIVCVNSPDELDQTVFNLPLMKCMGNNVTLTVKSIRKYESFYEDLKEMV